VRPTVRGAAALAASFLACAAAATTAAALPVLRQHSRWLTDPQGRAVILHGMQIDRYRPGTVVQYIDMNPANVRFMAAEGFNAARVSLAYAGYEKAPGKFDGSYLRQYKRFDHRLAASRVYDLVDIMQGQFSQSLAGSGFPDWMAQTDGLPNTANPFPQGYLVNPAENRAWDHLWADSKASDGVGLQEHLARGLHRIGRRMNRSPGLLGFDVFNEPWPGSVYPTCANPAGCPPGGFDQTLLTDFYRNVLPAVRAGAPRYPIFFEPTSLFDYAANTGLGDVGQKNAVFTFHNYCLGDVPGLPQLDPGGDCGIEEQMVLDEANAYADAKGVGALEDEWGNTASLPLLDRMVDEADASMMGWSYWAFEDCCNSTGAVVADATKPAAAKGNLRRSILRALVRPYPQAVAGTPLGWGYARDSGIFHLSYSTRSPAQAKFGRRARTRIELPALRYPTGYRVLVHGGRVTSPPDANRLVVASRRGASAVSLTVTPAKHHRPQAARRVPRDCSINSRHRVRLGSRGGPVRVATLYIDGRRFKRVSGREVRQVRLPPGLAGGTRLLVNELAAGGTHRNQRWIVRPCRPRPHSARNEGQSAP
jgi:endoglycosylceramidase